MISQFHLSLTQVLLYAGAWVVPGRDQGRLRTRGRLEARQLHRLLFRGPVSPWIFQPLETVFALKGT